MSPSQQVAVAVAAALGVAAGVAIARVQRKRRPGYPAADLDVARAAWIHGRLTRYFEEENTA